MNSPAEIAEQYVGIGKGKVALPVSKMIILAILAGCFIGFGATASTIAASTVSEPSLAKLISACIFPGGLTMVLLAGSELFTGNCLLVIPLMEGEIRWKGILRSWFFVYLGNFIGAFLVALCFFYGHLGGLFGGAVSNSIISAAAAKCTLSWTEALVRGVACNFLVCIAVWISFASKSPAGKVIGLFFPIMIFVLSGFEHSIANIFYIPAGLLAMTDPVSASAAVSAGIDVSGLTWTGFLLHNLLPVTIGNLFGGILVGMGYWFVYLKKPDDRKASAVEKETMKWEKLSRSV